MSGVLNSLGSEVSMILRSPLLRNFDTIVKDVLLEEMTKSGVKFYQDADTKSISKRNQKLDLVFSQHGTEKEIKDFDVIISAIGRSPNIDSLNLKNAGVELDSDNHIKVDEYQNTNVKGIYALGDVCGKLQLTPGELKIFIFTKTK